MKPAEPYRTQCRLCSRGNRWGGSCEEAHNHRLPFWAMPVIGEDLDHIYVKCVVYEKASGHSAAFENCFIWSDSYVNNPY